jgi:hypothetical protein
MIKKSDAPTEITIEKVHLGSAKVWIKGLSPMIFNCMSEKARHELLFPKGKKTTAERATQLKHDPLDEYRNSIYSRIGNGPTRLTFPAAGFKGAMSDAALEIPGAKKAQIQRLVWVVGDQVDIYGIPKLFMSVVRSSDMAHTPDIRTRAIVPEWACCVSVRFSTPTLNVTNLVNLLSTAGMLIGVGDFRQGKGKGNYGQFEVSEEESCKVIMASGGMAAQDAALKSPQFYDVESEKLYTWFEEERKKRGK